MKNDLLADSLRKELRPIDAGEYRDDWAGKSFQVWVNPPGVLDALIAKGEGESIGYEARRKVVAILYDELESDVRLLDDQLMLFLFAEGVTAYRDYHDNLKKKLDSDSPPGATPLQVMQ